MYLTDTNIFLEVLLEEEHMEECKEFLEIVSEGKITAFVTTFSLHTIAIIMEKLRDLGSYKVFLETITNFRGIIFYSTNPQDEIAICETAKKEALDFDDALHYYVAKKFGLEIVSFDKHFDNKRIKRLKPSEIIGKIR